MIAYFSLIVKVQQQMLPQKIRQSINPACHLRIQIRFFTVIMVSIIGAVELGWSMRFIIR